jgi:dephospho-CoA kinase
MKVFGVTGDISAGKTTITNLLKNYGFRIFDADREVRELYQIELVRNKISKIIGVDKSKDLKDSIKEKIKTDPLLIKEIEKYIHPLIEEKIKDFLSKKDKTVFMEIPLLFEAGFDKYCDKVILVKADKKERIKRISEREGFDRELFEIMEKRLFSITNKEEMSDYLINSSKEIYNTEHELKNILKNEGLI